MTTFCAAHAEGPGLNRVGAASAGDFSLSSSQDKTWMGWEKKEISTTDCSRSEREGET